MLATDRRQADAHVVADAVIVTENLFDNIHADPRWPAFLRKIGKAPEQLAKIDFKVTLPVAEGSTASGPAHP